MSSKISNVFVYKHHINSFGVLSYRRDILWPANLVPPSTACLNLPPRRCVVMACVKKTEEEDIDPLPKTETSLRSYNFSSIVEKFLDFIQITFTICFVAASLTKLARGAFTVCLMLLLELKEWKPVYEEHKWLIEVIKLVCSVWIYFEEKKEKKKEKEEKEKKEKVEKEL